ncbi:MAG: carboxypeptidase-like regulatory domain-containing protein [Acidobacteriota bacterium]
MDRTRQNLFLLFLLTGILPITGQVATGGNFTIEQSVIANGGGQSNGGTFAIVGTSGQLVAGTASASGPFKITVGFWQGFFAPTAARVSISGRVVNAAGYPISHAIVVFTSATGSSRVAATNPFGNYTVDGIEAGQALVVAVSAKSYQFAPRALLVQDSITHFDLVMLN